MKSTFRALLMVSVVIFVTLGQGCNLFPKGHDKTNGQDKTMGPEEPAIEQPLAVCPSTMNTNESSLLLIEADEGSTPPMQAGVLQLGTTMVETLHDGLLELYEPPVATAIANGANDEMIVAVGLLKIGGYDLLEPVEIVSAPIIKGAFVGMTDPCTNFSSFALLDTAAKEIIVNTTGALKGKTEALTSVKLFNLVGTMTRTAVETLPVVGMTGVHTSSALSSVTLAAVGALPEAGIEAASLSGAAQKIVEGATTALDTPGFEISSIDTFAGSVAGSAIEGLHGAGLSTESMIASGSIGKMISAAISGLKATSAGASGALSALPAIAGGTVSALSQSGFDTAEARQSALSTVIETAMNEVYSLAGDDSTAFADAMLGVATQTVKAVSQGGFNATEIASAVTTIVKTGVGKISEFGFSDAAQVTAIAKDLIEGTLAGTASLLTSGIITSTQLTEAASGASSGAIEGLADLQAAGAITGDAVSTFVAAVSTSITLGLESGGASTTLITSALSEVTAVLESDETTAQIETSAATAEAVATPTFSIAGGAYTVSILVSIQTSTTGASIRYTLDGTMPTTTSGTVYSTPIAINTPKNLLAIAYKTGWAPSAIKSETYTVEIPTFAAATTVATGNDPEGVAVGDMNGDGENDMAVALYAGQGASFLLGNGDGTFAAKQDVSNTGNSANIFSATIAIEDLNNDGKPDITYGAWGANYLSVLTNLTVNDATSLTFANANPVVYSPGISGPRAVAVADMDLDGDPDIAIGEGNGYRFVLYQNENATPGTFTKSTSTWTFNDTAAFTGHAHTWTIAIGDFNGDNKPDVVGGGGFAGRLSIILNANTVSGTPNFLAPNGINTNTSLGCTSNRTVSLADFNGDGKTDIVAPCPTALDHKIAIFTNTTTAGATVASFTTTSIDTPTGVAASTAGDVNNDGKVDIVSLSGGSTDTLNLYLGNGDGTFGPAEAFPVGSNSGPRHVMLADLNGDNRLDAIISNAATNTITVLLNQTVP